MKGVYCNVQIEGSNLDSLINILYRRGIYLKKIKKIDKKTLNLTIKHEQFEKVFAISNELCYNIKVIKTSGVMYPVLFLYRNLGVLIGGIIFFISAFFVNDLVLDITYMGSGKVLKNQVQSYLASHGVGQFTRFSDLELGKLSSMILSSNSNLSFVSCQKRGNTLYIELALAQNDTSILSGKAQSLVCDRVGVVEQIKVYRGTALVNVGDNVNIGQELVSGEVTVKDQVTNVNVIAVVTVIYEQDYEYYSSLKNREDDAQAFVEENYVGDGEIVGAQVVCSEYENGYKYTVRLSCRKTLFAG